MAAPAHVRILRARNMRWLAFIPLHPNFVLGGLLAVGRRAGSERPAVQAGPG